jgi:HD superfamily phosphodiesterase
MLLEIPLLMKLKPILLEKAIAITGTNDPSHDLLHICRVLKNAEYIASKEGGDLEVIIPSTLLHDVAMYSKNDLAQHKRVLSLQKSCLLN